MLFALVAFDQPGHVAQRMELRPDHLKFLESLGSSLKLAGPYQNEAGELVGSIVIIEAASLADARAAFARDPYAQAGLFDTVSIKPWKAAITRF